MRERRNSVPDYCMIEAAMEIVGGKWKMAIVNHLFAGPQRFGQLRRAMPTITQRMLTRQLRELEADGLVQRTVYPQVPPKVEYALTAIGASLQPIADQLESWGHWYRQHLDRAPTAPTEPPT
jgi:DNA-binding HxlR family transcriptional regulator